MDVSGFNTPDEVLDWTLARLARATADRKSPWRWPVLCTAGGSGRVIVLRSFDRESRLLRLYTDRRSQKVIEISSSPDVELVFFDPGRMVQLRASGPARIVTEGAEWQAALDALPDHAKSDYAQRTPPGEPVKDPDPDLVDGLTHETFAMIDVTFSQLRWLAISRDKHRAVTSTWSGTRFENQWVAP